MKGKGCSSKHVNNVLSIPLRHSSITTYWTKRHKEKILLCAVAHRSTLLKGVGGGLLQAEASLDHTVNSR